MATGTWRTSEPEGVRFADAGVHRLGILRSGVMLMLAFAVGYAVWSVLVAAFPAATTQMLNALFHGVDFGKLELEASEFSLARLGIGTALWALKGLVFGVVFAAIYNMLGRLTRRTFSDGR